MDTTEQDLIEQNGLRMNRSGNIMRPVGTIEMPVVYRSTAYGARGWYAAGEGGQLHKTRLEALKRYLEIMAEDEDGEE